MMTHRAFTAAGLVLIFGVGSAFAQQPPPDPNAPGVKQLGVDVSKAGTTPEQNRQFVNNLPADQQAKVLAQCLVVVADEGVLPEVATFCKNVGQQQ